jgi:hypothetical protein
MERAQTSAHEAGHAFEGRMRGLAVERVSVRRCDEDDSLGRVIWRDRHRDDPFSLRNLLVVCFAGQAAVAAVAALRHRTAPLTTAGDRHDREHARDVALKLRAATGEDPTTALDRAQAEAREAVRRHVHTIAAVADELNVRGEMSGPELDATIERAQRARISALSPGHLYDGATVQKRAKVIEELELRNDLAARDRQLRSAGVAPAKRRAKRVGVACDHTTRAGREKAAAFHRVCLERFCAERGMTRAETVVHIGMVTTLARTGMVTR